MEHVRRYFLYDETLGNLDVSSGRPKLFEVKNAERIVLETNSLPIFQGLTSKTTARLLIEAYRRFIQQRPQLFRHHEHLVLDDINIASRRDRGWIQRYKILVEANFTIRRLLSVLHSI